MRRFLLMSFCVAGCQSGESAKWREANLGDLTVVLEDRVDGCELVRFDTVSYAGQFARVETCLSFSVDGASYTPIFLDEALAGRAAEIVGRGDRGAKIVGGGALEQRSRSASGLTCPAPYFLINELLG